MDGPDHHYHPLVRQAARALRQRCGVMPGSSIIVACSGGADSVALLRVLAMLAGRRKWGLKLVVGHVQHHLRDEAENDARFVEALAGELGLPYARRDIHPAELPGNLEANARRLRYAGLGEVANEYDAAFIATAHHADDQLETLLMQMLRGASVSGLRGIAWGRPHPTQDGAIFVIRPMLAIGRDDITTLLGELGQPYRQDATNLDTNRTRARLRHDVLPVLKQIQSDATQKAGELVEHFSDVYRLIDAAAEEQSERSGGGPLNLSREAARTINRVVLGEMLRNALINEGVPAGRVTRNALMPAVAAAQDTVGGTRVFTFANGVTLAVTRETVSIARGEQE